MIEEVGKDDVKKSTDNNHSHQTQRQRKIRMAYG